MHGSCLWTALVCLPNLVIFITFRPLLHSDRPLLSLEVASAARSDFVPTGNIHSLSTHVNNQVDQTDENPKVTPAPLDAEELQRVFAFRGSQVGQAAQSSTGSGVDGVNKPHRAVQAAGWTG